MKLTYFDIPGKAEAIRLCAAVGHVAMEDVRITREEFAALQASGGLPFGQVPSLEVDGEILAQSSSILRYVGTVGGLHPAGDLLACARIDSLVCAEEDMFCGVSVSRYGPRFGFDMTDAFRENVRRSLNDEVLPRHLLFLEKKLGASDTGWLAGTEQPSIADFVFVPRLQWLVSGANDGIDGRAVYNPFSLSFVL
jgi:glutathione S-transferase